MPINIIAAWRQCPDADGGIMLAQLRRLLDFQLSIAELIGIGLVVGTPYLIAGVVWSFFHPDGVQRIQTQLEQQLQLPPGTGYELAGLGAAAALWPVVLVLPSGACAH
jgi:hypothetical protein